MYSDYKPILFYRIKQPVGIKLISARVEDSIKNNDSFIFFKSYIVYNSVALCYIFYKQEGSAPIFRSGGG